MVNLQKDIYDVSLEIASVSDTGGPPSPVSQCSLVGMLLAVQ